MNLLQILIMYTLFFPVGKLVLRIEPIHSVKQWAASARGAVCRNGTLLSGFEPPSHGTNTTY